MEGTPSGPDGPDANPPAGWQATPVEPASPYPAYPYAAQFPPAPPTFGYMGPPPPRGPQRKTIVIIVGVTAAAIIAVVAVTVYLVTAVLPTALGGKTPNGAQTSSQTMSVRVASSSVMTKAGTGEPKVVLSFYEDFLCPACGRFEQIFGPTITELVDNGSVAADYYMVAILDATSNQNYSSRAGGAGYCVADADDSPDKSAFRRFHAALFAQQPSETGSTFPSNADLIETARQAGVVGSVPDCVANGRYAEVSAGLANATNVNATPTVRINGEDFEYSTPNALAAKVKELLG